MENYADKNVIDIINKIQESMNKMMLNKRVGSVTIEQAKEIIFNQVMDFISKEIPYNDIGNYLNYGLKIEGDTIKLLCYDIFTAAAFRGRAIDPISNKGKMRYEFDDYILYCKPDGKVLMTPKVAVKSIVITKKL